MARIIREKGGGFRIDYIKTDVVSSPEELRAIAGELYRFARDWLDKGESLVFLADSIGDAKMIEKIMNEKMPGIRKFCNVKSWGRIVEVTCTKLPMKGKTRR